MPKIEGAELRPNWTTAAGALEGVLAALGVELPRHAIMGLTGHAWHAAVSSRGEVHVLPDGPVNLDWSRMVQNYERLGLRWERFGAALPAGDDWSVAREAAIDWVTAQIDRGRPVVAWDLHLHEFGIISGYDRDRGAFLADTLATAEVGPLAHWDEWPSSLGLIELFAPGEAFEPDAVEVVGESLATAMQMFAGDEGRVWGANRDGPEASVVRGTAAFALWAELLEGDAEIDRAGNAYSIAVVQAARLDGADFLADLAEGIPDLAPSLREAERALREMVKALAPLITLFPFPSGGHGNVDNPGLRRAAAMPLRRCAQYEGEAAEAIGEAVRLLEGEG